MTVISIRLYQKISRILGLGAGIVVVVLLGLFYHFSSTMAEKLLQAKMDATVKTTVSALSVPLWNMDYERVDALLNQVMNDKDILYAHLQDSEGKIISKAQAGFRIDEKEVANVNGKAFAHTHKNEDAAFNQFLLSTPVLYVESLGGKEQSLGTLKIIYSNAIFIQSERRTTITVGVVGFVLFSVLIMFISSVTKRALDPIETLSRYISSTDETGEDEWDLPDATTYEILQLLQALHTKRESTRNHAMALQRQLIEVNEARVYAEEAAKVKTEFLANMSHELRTPMHAILNFANLGNKSLKNIDNSDKLAKYLSNIQTAGNRLLGLINNLLDISKMEAGKMNYDFQYGDFMSVVQQAHMEMEALFKLKKVKLKSELVGTTSVACFDEHRMIQVVVNILANALRYSPEGKTVTVTLSEPELIKTAGIPMLMCAIEDQGKGIPKGEHQTIFDKFVQSSNTSSANGGTGLGLSICRQIIEAHHGRIWAEDGAEDGARFCFTLPQSCTVIEGRKLRVEDAILGEKDAILDDHSGDGI